MTVAEINRYLEGATWRMKSQAQFDYILANLIGVSVARVVSSDTEFPSIEKVYPTLFDENDAIVKAKQEQIEAEKAAAASTNRFLEFALKHNERMKKNKEV